MPLFPSIERAGSKHGAHVRAFQKLYEFHGFRTGSPRDFLQLAPRLAASEAFRLDFSDLVRATRDREHGRLTAGEMMTIAGVAIGGPGISTLEMELLESAAILQVLLAGVGGWRDQPDQAYPGPAWDTADAERERRERLGYSSAEAWGLAGDDLRRGSQFEGEGRREEPEEILDAAEVSPEMRETLDRLELASLELKLHLEEMERRIDADGNPDSARQHSGAEFSSASKGMPAEEEELNSWASTVRNRLRTDKEQETATSESTPEPTSEPVRDWKASAEYQANARAARTMFAEGMEADRAEWASQRNGVRGDEAEELPVSSLELSKEGEAIGEPVLAPAGSSALSHEQASAAKLPPAEESRSVHEGGPATPEIEMPPEAEERRSRASWIALIALLLVGAFGLAYVYLPMLRQSSARSSGAANSSLEAATSGDESRTAAVTEADGVKGSEKVEGSAPGRNGGVSRSTGVQGSRAGAQESKAGLRSTQDRPLQEQTAPSTTDAAGARAGIAGVSGDGGLSAARSDVNGMDQATEARRTAAFERAAVGSGGALPAQPSENAGGGTVRVPDSVPVGTGGRVLVAPGPMYPREARDRGIEGKVVVRALVDTGGRVTGVQVLDGPAELRQSAADAVRRRRYEPFVVKGEAAPFQTLVTLNYKLMR